MPHQAVTPRDTLVGAVQSAICELHWKDFETLVDLLFRQAGWRRLSVLGETMKYADLELEEPITTERYQVQIKSAADTADFARYRGQFEGRGFQEAILCSSQPHRKASPGGQQRRGRTRSARSSGSDGGRRRSGVRVLAKIR